MFVDKVKIKVKAGDGGNGSQSFFRDKMNAHGGPDGGDGGRGGSIIIRADKNMTSLVDYYYQRVFRAENGVQGLGNRKDGKNGADKILYVPLGTVVKTLDGREIADITSTEGELKLLTGGAGGRGNTHFATPTRQAPCFSEQGEKTKEFEVVLELKMIADVGLIGFPNVGKSTILSVISAAKPKVANYHFTTLVPNLGVVKFFDKSFIVADIPGLIEGASEGAGLGHDFLRHIERTRLLVHVVDASGLEGRNPLEDFEKINNELSSYSEFLSSLPQILVLNKADITENIEQVESEFKAKYPNLKILKLSAVTQQGVKELISEVANSLGELPEVEEKPIEANFVLDARDRTSINITRNDAAEFIVTGGYVEHLSRGVIIDDIDSFAYFQRRIKEDGVLDMLREKGAKNGDTVIMGEITFEMVD